MFSLDVFTSYLRSVFLFIFLTCGAIFCVHADEMDEPGIQVETKMATADATGSRQNADGFLVLFENSLITNRSQVLIPYFNLFFGFDRPQSLARAADAGGVLRNTGINFETDGLTGFPKLDDTTNNTWGGHLDWSTCLISTNKLFLNLLQCNPLEIVITVLHRRINTRLDFDIKNLWMKSGLSERMLFLHYWRMLMIYLESGLK